MRIDIFSLFPEMFFSPLDSSILKRAASQGLVHFNIHNIRDYTHDRHHTADDYAYGGGAGMVMKAEPVFEAVETVLSRASGMTGQKPPVILMTPQGRQFNQEIAQELSTQPWLMMICGHYEGIDERIREHLATDEISLGDYILTGGELAAMVISDAVVRLIPAVLGSEESLVSESFTGGLLEYPQYTRPEVYRGWRVPEVLLSGNHAEIAKWRREQAIRRTAERRPELLEKAGLTIPEKNMFRTRSRQTD
ncbi:MAG TPA: tRNA (guanosine(37)-N1)-methyltransferase TrmD [Dehalococcoidales bacterium]|nr:tRNA (guanosine(37)-N1)-methyltransferase TrmD [Dehalococcoidales bacterium]